MGKRSAGQIALDKIDAEIRDLQRLRERLIDAIELKPKRKPKKTQREEAHETYADAALGR